ncbi:MAG TPA: MIP/aquaporin family protein [Hyphomonadaceae bacterium]|jgi:glycerol uptake facilitator-like aquaporin|nr:MIP/aquaporin family protein [Hyphomonadaceae bacterium]
MDLYRRLAAEGLGACLLSATVIGSGILGTALSGGNDGVALLGNTLATAAILYVLVATLGPISGAHFNPAVTLVFLLRGEIRPAHALLYLILQIAGCIAGALLAHAMFGLPLLQTATTDRSGAGRILAEGAATFALVIAILGGVHYRPNDLPAIVALVIAAGYWWTASTSFANPAITIARSLSDTFAGVRPQDAPGFIAGQLAGAVAGWLAGRLLFARSSS